MQIAAMNPKYISQADIPDDYKEHEKEILLAQAIEENNKLPENKRKPQNIIEKMLIGRLNKEFKEICLLDQVYVRAEDGKQTVGQKSSFASRPAKASRRDRTTSLRKLWLRQVPLRSNIAESNNPNCIQALCVYCTAPVSLH